MKNENIYRLGVKNMLYSIMAQGLFFILSIVTGFLLPKAMGVIQYGYWQVYIFYNGYIMLFAFGFNDGLYLRYGNLNYEQLPFEKLRSAMRIFILVCVILACILFGLSFLEFDSNKVFAFCAVSVNLLILGINGTLLTILQFTNRIKLNSILIIANKFLFVIFVIPLLLVDWVNFKIIIMADIVTKLILLGVIIYKLKELFLGDTENNVLGAEEYWKDVVIGSKLMMANIVSLLLIGIGRFMVERFMPLESYSLYSFATTVITFALLFITASSVAMYPFLKRVPVDKLPTFYGDINTLLCVGSFFLLAGYYPLYYLIQYYFTDFVGIFEYFYLLFIIIVSQGKMQFLINTYYKVLREEKAMLTANITGAIVALILIIPSFYYTHSIFAIVSGTTIALIWRCYASEIFLKKIMGIKDYRNIAIELGIMVFFALCVMVVQIPWGFFGYLFIVCLYGIGNRYVLWKYFSALIKFTTER